MIKEIILLTLFFKINSELSLNKNYSKDKFIYNPNKRTKVQLN